MTWLYIAVGIGIVAIMVFGSMRDRKVHAQDDDTLAALASAFGLSTVEDGLWSGTIAGQAVHLHKTRSDAFAQHTEIYSKLGQEADQLHHNATVRIHIPSAPAELRIGVAIPLTQNRHKLGHEDFDRRYAVKSAPPEVLAWLTEARIKVLEAHPLHAWITDSTFIVNIGRQDATAQQRCMQNALDAALALN